MSALENPNSAESAEEAALKASGPMPCALLIVTRAFLPSNSDWWARRGYSSQETSGGGKTRCWSPISPVRGLTLGTLGRRAFSAPILDTGLVSSPLPHNRPVSLPSYRSWSILPPNTAQSPHLISTVSTTWANCPPAVPPCLVQKYTNVIFLTLIFSFSFCFHAKYNTSQK